MQVVAPPGPRVYRLRVHLQERYRQLILVLVVLVGGSDGPGKGLGVVGTVHAGRRPSMALGSIGREGGAEREREDMQTHTDMQA